MGMLTSFMGSLLQFLREQLLATTAPPSPTQQVRIFLDLIPPRRAVAEPILSQSSLPWRLSANSCVM